jgi:hypothetical protein
VKGNVFFNTAEIVFALEVAALYWSLPELRR